MSSEAFPRILLGVILCFAIPGCGGGGGGDNSDSGDLPPVDAPANGGRIVFFGDSLTDGYTLGKAKAYPAHVQRKIDEQAIPFTVANFGVSGDTSADGLARIDAALIEPVSIFFLALGANDGLRGVDVNLVRQNLAQILDRVRSKYPNVKLVIAGMIDLRQRGNDYSADFAAVFPELASTYKATLMPFLLKDVFGHEALYLSDGIHPNAEGHKFIAENVFGTLLPLFDQ